MIKGELTELDCEIVLAFAENDMKVSETAQKFFFHRNTIEYHLDKVKRKTGLNPKKFYDLTELVLEIKSRVMHL